MDYKKEFIDIFNELSRNMNSNQAWNDLIDCMAASISNATDKAHFDKREADYMTCAKRLGFSKAMGDALGCVIEAFEHNPEQDFLGVVYGDLGLLTAKKGQFFSPYSVCKMMAGATLEKDSIEKRIAEHGYITINDPACGAGATLIAAANTLWLDYNINYQTSALFTANDIDPVVAKMCYIQLSLLGCPGYVAVADTLCDPVVGDVLSPVEKETQDFWYTPMYFSDVWAYRRVFRGMDHLFSRPSCLPCKTEKKENEPVESYQMDISEFLAT